MPTDRPEEPSRPPRIIVPGAETTAPGGAPRIVLPPGASIEPADDLPEYPRLRPLVIVPVVDQERELLLVSDPLGVIPGQPVLGMGALALLQLLDGSASVNDITAAVMRDSKDLRVGNMVRDFIRQLDELLMLDSPRFHRAYQELREAYHPLEIRPAALEGHAYPATAPELKSFLDENFLQAVALRDAAKEKVAAADAVPRALLVPHLDPRRAGVTMARAYLEIGAEPKEPLRVVVLGTGHTLTGDRFALTRKHFQTPLGKLECDTAFVDTLAAALGDEAYHGELAHRDEHSIEFQVLYLQRRLGARRVKIVPILCGGFHELLDEGRTPGQDEPTERFVAALRAAETWHGGTTLYVGAIDLSHVGPRFDPREGKLDDRTRKEVEQKDHAALDAAVRGEADGWFAAIAEHDDSTRICGLAPTYLLLRAAAGQAGLGRGRLLRYQQSDEADGSMVSTAAMVWP
jgi:AmmeMemoRadiSam system protein B